MNDSDDTIDDGFDESDAENDFGVFMNFTFDTTSFDAETFWVDIDNITQPQRLTNITDLVKVYIPETRIDNIDEYASQVAIRIIEYIKKINPKATSQDVRVFLYNRYGLTFI